MGKKRSELEYDIIPFAEVDVTSPIIVITEMNDSYTLVLFQEGAEKLGGSASQDERGGIAVSYYDSFEDYRTGEEIDGMPLNEMTESDMFLENGVLKITKLTGAYKDPERLFEDFYEGNDGDED